MGRPVSFPSSGAQRALLALAASGAVLGTGAPGAHAAEAAPATGVPVGRATATLGEFDARAGLRAATATLGYVTGTVAGLKPNPLAGTGVDPLDNAVGTRLADFRPLSSKALTGPVAQAESIGRIPVVGDAVGLLGR